LSLTFVCKYVSAERTLSLQVVLESSNDRDHADGNFECCGTDASEEAFGDDNNIICLNGSRVSQCDSHGVAQVAIHSQVASQGAGIVEVYNNAVMAMCNYLQLQETGMLNTDWAGKKFK
jgi:hypothetical protein